MPECCVQGCDNFNNDGKKNFTFFSFPTHNKILLKKWLHQIELPNCKPAHQKICSAHFTKDDIAGYSNGLQPSLKPESVPTIFPVQKSKNSDKKVSEWIVKKVPDDLAIKNINIDVNKNCNMPLMQSLPLILVPPQFFHQNERQFPILVPGQCLQQIGLQNSPQIQQMLLTKPFNAEQSVQFLQQRKSQNLEQAFHFDQKHPSQIWLIQNGNRQTSITKSKFGQVNTQNTIKISEIPQLKTEYQEQTSRLSHTKAENQMKVVEFSQGDTKNENKQNSLCLTAIPQTNVQMLIKLSSVSQSNAESPKENNSQISSMNIQTPVQRSQNMKMTSQNLTKTTNESEKNVKNSVRTKLQNPLSKPIEILLTSFNQAENPPEISERPTQESTTSQPKSTSNSDILSMTKLRNPQDLTGPKSSSASCPLSDKRPKLHITVSKRYDISSESEMNSSHCEDKNTIMDEKSTEKSITIENSRANKSVTFRLDRNTGEIVVETREMNKSSTKNEQTRSRRRRRKVNNTYVLEQIWNIAPLQDECS